MIVKHSTILQWGTTQKLIVAYGIANAMSYLHKNNILHRDLTLKNVLLNKFLFPKLGDFGLAKQITPDSSSNDNDNDNDPKTSHNDKNEKEKSGIFGTPGFIAPEVYRENKYSKESDVYSFGILLYELWSNKDPYKNFELLNIMYRVSYKNERPAKLKTINENYWILIKRCWEEDPKKRPSFDEIVNELINEPKYIIENIDVGLFKEYVSFIQDQNNISSKFKKIYLMKKKNKILQ